MSLRYLPSAQQFYLPPRGWCCGSEASQRSPPLNASPMWCILFQLRRPKQEMRTPNVSPFCIKVEAFLRLHKIPYVVEYPARPSSKNERYPYIEYNGTITEESNAIIEYLGKEFSLAGLSEGQQVTQTLLRRTLDLSSYWHSLRWLFVDHFEYVYKISVVPFPPGFLRRQLLKYIRGSMIKSLNANGLGDLSTAEYHQEWLRDVQAVEATLEAALKKGKWFGGESPNAIDCQLYSFLCSWVGPTPPASEGVFDPPAMNYARSSKVLVRFVKQFEAIAFPDLEELLQRTDGSVESYLGTSSPPSSAKGKRSSTPVKG